LIQFLLFICTPSDPTEEGTDENQREMQRLQMHLSHSLHHQTAIIASVGTQLESAANAPKPFRQEKNTTNLFVFSPRFNENPLLTCK